MFEGKGIGEIMQWLDKQLGNVNESLCDYLKYSNEDNIENYIE